MLREPSAVIFDLDGAMINNRPIHREIRTFISEIYFDLGFPISADSPSDNNYFRMLNKAGLNPSQIAVYFRLWDKLDALTKPRIFSCANQLIVQLKRSGKTVGIVSNRSASAKNSIIASGLRWENFDFIISVAADKLGRVAPYEKLPNQYVSDVRKPDKRIIDPVRPFLEALPDYPESVLYIGDNIIDYQFAQNNSFAFVGVLSGDVETIEIWEMAGVERENIINNIAGLDKGLNKYID